MITKEQVDYIRENYGKESATKIAGHLDIFPQDVRYIVNKLRKLGIVGYKLGGQFDWNDYSKSVK